MKELIIKTKDRKEIWISPNADSMGDLLVFLDEQSFFLNLKSLKEIHSHIGEIIKKNEKQSF